MYSWSVRAATRSRSAPFSPVSLAPARWGEARKGGLFQSNAGTTAAVADGDVVGYYPDQSGNSFTLTSAADSTVRPALGGVGVAPYLSFDGSNDQLRKLTALGSYAAGASSWFAAVRSSTQTTTKILMADSSNTNATYGLLGVSSVSTSLGARLTNDAVGVVENIVTQIYLMAWNNMDHVIGVVDDGATLTPYVDGVVGTPVAYTRSGVFSVDRFALGCQANSGGGAFWAGRVYGEVLVNRVLTSTEIANLTAYLQQTYAVANTSNPIAANRAQLPDAVASIAQNDASARTHYAPADSAVTGLQLVHVGFYLGNTQASPTVNSDARTIACYIEYPSSTFTQFTWSSSTSVTVAAGGQTISDLLAVAIPAGASFVVHEINLNGTVTHYPVISLPANASTIGVLDTNYASGGTPSHQSSASAAVNFQGPAAILGTLTTAGTRSFVIYGDSIQRGTGDVSSVGGRGGSGWTARMLDIHGYPYVKVAKGGWESLFLLGPSQPIRDFLAAIKYTDVIYGHGGNDLQLASSTAAQLQDADKLGVLSFVQSGVKIWLATILPRTTSTDSWATTANQTVLSTGTWSLLATINNARRAAGYLGPVSYSVLDAADAGMTSRDSGKWPAPPAPTVDGIHPNSVEAAALATALSSLI